MEKETKRALQNILEILREQQDIIYTLRQSAMASRRSLDDGIENRINRITNEISEQAAYEIDWARLCDRHYATRS